MECSRATHGANYGQRAQIVESRYHATQKSSSAMTMRDPMTLQCQQHAPAVQGENSTNGHIPDRLSVALAHYLDLMDQGIAPEPTDYVRSFPDVAEALLECLCTLQWIDTAKRQSLSNDKMSSRGPIADEVRALSHGMLSHYRLLSPLGHGGMGVVYQAVDTRTGVGVALKILPHRSLTDAKAMVRFFNEAQIASTLEHPHIVKVTDVGSERGVPFFVMPQANPRHTHFPRVLGSLGRPVAAFPILPSLRRKGLCLVPECHRKLLSV